MVVSLILGWGKICFYFSSHILPSTYENSFSIPSWKLQNSISNEYLYVIMSSKTLPAAKQVQPWDTSGRKTLPTLDISGLEPWDKSRHVSGVEISQVRTCPSTSGPDLSLGWTCLKAELVQLLQDWTCPINLRPEVSCSRKCLTAGSFWKFRAGSVSKPELLHGSVLDLLMN